MAEAAAGVLYAVEHLVEGAVLAAKGIYDPTLPLKASIKPLPPIDISLAYHSISVIKGRAYLFGGKTTTSNGGEQLAANDMHIVILPSSGVESTDYAKVEVTSDAPPRRYGHSAAVIEDRIHIFGGSGENGKPLEENGRVWIFDTTTKTWSHFDPPANGHKPAARVYASAVATRHPQPPQDRADEDIMPQQPPDPENMVPTIPDTDTYGTLIVQGGQSSDGQNLNDIWTFDVSSRTWSELPEPPPPTSSAPSLAMLENRLYTFSAGQTSYLDLDPGAFDDRWGKGELGLVPLGSWQSIPPAASSPEKHHPGERTGACMVPVTTGQGRNYLLLVGGQSATGEGSEDIWALQLKPEETTAASLKDRARHLIKKDTGEAEWREVKYYNSEGVMVQEGQVGRGVGTRKGFAGGKGGEVDGGSVVVWGGIGEDGKARADGVMISVEI